MRRAALALIVVALAFSAVALAGCGKEIKGSCETVVRQCQELSANEKATVVVTGIPIISDGTSGLLYISDNGSNGGAEVWVYLKDKIYQPITGRITFKGELMPEFTKPDSITICDATIAD